MAKQRKKLTAFQQAASVVESLEDGGHPFDGTNAEVAQFYRALAAMAGDKASEYARRGKLTQPVRRAALAGVVRAVWSYCDLTQDCLADVVRNLLTVDNADNPEVKAAAAAMAIAEADYNTQSGKAA